MFSSWKIRVPSARSALLEKHYKPKKLHTMENPKKEVFERQLAVWEIEMGEVIDIVHDGYVVSTYTQSDLNTAAKEFANMVERSVRAMVKNNAKKLTLTCTWVEKKGGEK